MLQSTRERGERHAEAHHAVVGIGIDYAGDKVEVGTTDVVIDQTRDLVVRKMGKTVETIVGAVDDVEELFAFTALYKVKNTVFAYLRGVTSGTFIRHSTQSLSLRNPS